MNTSIGQPVNFNPRKVFSFCQMPGWKRGHNRAIRFNHGTNSWEVNRVGAPDKWNQCNVELARSYASAGFAIGSKA